MRILFSFLSISMCLLCIQPAHATPDSLSASNLILKVSPQHLFVNTVYLELEKRLHAESKHSLIFAPRFNYGGAEYINSLYERNHEFDQSTRVRGYGASLQHRIYISEEINLIPHGMYVAYGVDYQNLQVRFIREGYGKETDENGLEVYKFRQRNFLEAIKRYGAVVMGGLQVPLLQDKIVADISMGVGYRKSNSTTNFGRPVFNEGPADFSYTGSYVLMNLKFGYAF